jgi:hypothetical protein
LTMMMLYLMKTDIMKISKRANPKRIRKHRLTSTPMSLIILSRAKEVHRSSSIYHSNLWIHLFSSHLLSMLSWTHNGSISIGSITELLFSTFCLSQLCFPISSSLSMLRKIQIWVSLRWWLSIGFSTLFYFPHNSRYPYT